MPSPAAAIWDDRPCELGEGPLWDPRRGRLWWFDILDRRLLWRQGADRGALALPEMASAAGLAPDGALLVATETRLMLLDPDSGAERTLAPLEADNPATRSNDGRADPWGGFWIGTMGKAAETRAGAIYRYYRGEVRKLVPDVTIPNAICFAPDGGTAYFADTRKQRVWRLALSEPDGWPAGDPEPFLDLRGDALFPDGAVTDAEGNFWNAQWGAGRVAAYDPSGKLLRVVTTAARHSSCPVFGGADGNTLFCTSAREGLSSGDIDATPGQGMTFAAPGIAAGVPPTEVQP